MHGDDALPPAARAALIRTPDQVQQEKSPAAERQPRPESAGPRAEAPPSTAGILGQLRTERAHD